MSGLGAARVVIAAFDPMLPGQEVAQTTILEFMDAHPDALSRTCADGHLTGSALVVAADRSRALLMHHRKLGMWLQMGGHADGEADLRAVAAREAAEESGIAGLAVGVDPVDLDVHLIDGIAGERAHLHLDVRYLAVAPAHAVATGNMESLAVRWFTLAEIEGLGVDASTLRLARLGLQSS